MKAIYALIGWSVVIIILSLMPVSSDQYSFFEHEDKAAHFIIYMVQCILIIFCLKGSQINKYVYAVLASGIFGITMEILQAALNTGRHFDYFDIIANISGSLIGSFLFYLLRKNIHNG